MTTDDHACAVFKKKIDQMRIDQAIADKQIDYGIIKAFSIQCAFKESRRQAQRGMINALIIDACVLSCGTGFIPPGLVFPDKLRIDGFNIGLASRACAKG